MRSFCELSLTAYRLLVAHYTAELACPAFHAISINFSVCGIQEFANAASSNEMSDGLSEPCVPLHQAHGIRVRNPGRYRIKLCMTCREFSRKSCRFPCASALSTLMRSVTPRTIRIGMPFRVATHAMAPDSQSTTCGRYRFCNSRKSRGVKSRSAEYMVVRAIDTGN